MRVARPAARVIATPIIVAKVTAVRHRSIGVIRGPIHHPNLPFGRWTGDRLSE
jgi:hypothetical protein